MKTVHVCTLYGVTMRFHRVDIWYTRDDTGRLYMLRDGAWESVLLERRHVGVYATMCCS